MARRNADGAAVPLGFIVLAMGKFGAGELNYSSDVDLIVFYDPTALRSHPGWSHRSSSCG